MEKISVIVPVYNAEKYLDGCIDSIVSQDYPELEILLVDDGSTDGSERICLDHAARDGRIIYIRQENRGVSAARNRGIAASSGEWICFADSDDRLEENALSLLASLAGEPETDLVIGGFVTVGKTEENVSPPKTEKITGKENIARFAEEHFRKPFIGAVMGKLYRREITGQGFDVGSCMGEDVIFNVGCFSRARSVTVSDRAVYRYNTQNEGSLVNTMTAEKYRQSVESSLCFEKWVKSELGEDYPCRNVSDKTASGLYWTARSVVKDPALGETPADRIAALAAPDVRRAAAASAGSFGRIHRVWFRLFLSEKYRACAFLTVLLNGIRKVLGK